MCGWLNDLADFLDNHEEIELHVVAPQAFREETVRTKWGQKSQFWGVHVENVTTTQYDKNLENKFDNILQEVQPDIVHIFGTEYMHTLAMVKAFQHPERTVIHIQGLVSVYAKHYDAYLPPRTVVGGVLTHFVQMQEIPVNQKLFEERGKMECEAIANVQHVMGRTDWDRACVKRMNPHVNYHHVEEILRSPFYQGKWLLESCKPHRIFMTQGSYPIKGLHIALEALAILQETYADVQLIVGGSDAYSTLAKRHGRVYSYNAYIHNLIETNNLRDNLSFCGGLTAEEVKRQMLQCNVFILPSSIENSSNSLGEAALLGVPIAASYVGGTPSIIEHKKTGLLYPADAPYMLADAIAQIFEDRDLAKQLSENSTRMAHAKYNRNNGLEEVLSVYREMIQ
jgi:glycosyltransferase involved in cell wall biosynthesis